MRTTTTIPTETTASTNSKRFDNAESEQARAALKVLMNHIYELHKGIRHMVLFTCNKKYGKNCIISIIFRNFAVKLYNKI